MSVGVWARVLVCALRSYTEPNPAHVPPSHPKIFGPGRARPSAVAALLAAFLFALPLAFGLPCSGLFEGRGFAVLAGHRWWPDFSGRHERPTRITDLLTGTPIPAAGRIRTAAGVILAATGWPTTGGVVAAGFIPAGCPAVVGVFVGAGLLAGWLVLARVFYLVVGPLVLKVLADLVPAVCLAQLGAFEPNLRITITLHTVIAVAVLALLFVGCAGLLGDAGIGDPGDAARRCPVQLHLDPGSPEVVDPAAVAQHTADRLT